MYVTYVYAFVKKCGNLVKTLKLNYCREKGERFKSENNGKGNMNWLN